MGSSSSPPALSQPLNAAPVIGPSGTFTQYWFRLINDVFTAVTGLLALQTQITDQTLTVNGPTAIAAPTVVEEAWLVQIVRQDSTGGRHASWSTTYYDNPPSDTGTTLSTESIFVWIGHNGKWLFLNSFLGRPLSAT